MLSMTEAISNLGYDYVNKVAGVAKQAGANNVGIKVESDSFDSIFNAVSGVLDSTNSYIQRAQQAEIDFALGNMTNTHELGVYQQQANLALQYTVAIRDRALEAYNSIMNMQI